MGTTAEKGAYLNTTKSLLKQKINNLGGDITDNTTFRQYAEKIQTIYDNAPKTDFEEGSNITVENCLKGKLDFEDDKVGYGDTEQNGTPTPTTPIPINTVTGEQDITIRGINLFNINDYTDITFSTNNSTVTKYETYFKCATNGENFSGAYINTYTVNPSIYQALNKYNGKTLRFSFKAKADVSMDLYFGIGSVVQRNTITTDWQTYSMTVPDYDASKSIVFYNQGTILAETNFYIKEIQLEVGTTTSPYEPYITPITKTLDLGNIELAEIGTYRDYIWTDRSTGKWYKHSAIDKIASYNGETISTTYMSTTGQLTTGATVYYGKTTTDTEITGTTLLEQLEDIYNIMSLNGTTIIEIAGNLPMIIKVRALKGE